MRYSRFALIAIGSLLLGGMAAPRANWDRITWTMSPPQAQAAYPAGRYDYPFLYVDQATIAKGSPLADMIEPDTRVLIHFTYEGGYHADYVELLVPGTFEDAARRIKARYGKPVYGAEDESACFDKDGQRIVTDPSGVGHVLAICNGFATFVDRPGGNAIQLGREGRADMFRKDAGFAPYGAAPFVIIRIGDLARCLECAGPAAR